MSTDKLNVIPMTIGPMGMLAAVTPEDGGDTQVMALVPTEATGEGTMQLLPKGDGTFTGSRGSGPPKVNSEAYKQNYDRIFSKEVAEA